MADKGAREKRMKNALDRIKSLTKITDDRKSGAPVPIRGNQVSKGTSLSEDAREAAKASYFDALRDRLHENWALPVWLARQNLSAQVQIYVDSHGRLSRFTFLRPSGNQQFDEAVKRALSESQPYPVPPEQLRGTFMADGVSVGFPL
jgi:TonB family protein